MNVRRSIRVYRALSGLYPKSFRDEYGDDLVATFAEQLRDGRATTVWLSTIRDLLVTVPSHHLEARMHRPAARTVAVVATAITVSALVLAVVAGTGPIVGVFLFAALVGLILATLAWRSARPAGPRAEFRTTRWRTFLGLGIALLAAVIVVINVPPYNDEELPGAGWALMMLSLLTSVALITIGATTGIAQRSTRRSTNA